MQARTLHRGMRLWTGFIFATRLVAGLVVSLAAPARADDAVSRGRYLAILGDCAGCHTAPHGKDFAGGLSFTASFGTVYSTNITPDRQTGIGDWTKEQFYRALHEGISADGRHLYPAFPYVYFSRLTRQDTDDLFAWLKTVKPVKQAPTPNHVMFPINIRWGLTFWNWLYLPKSPPALPANTSAQWRRGEYLVNGLGHCAECHTPKDMLFGDETSKALSGGVVDHWFSANLTASPTDGLSKWTAADIGKYLATGRNRYATAAGSMEEKVSLSTSHMTDSDRMAIATYLKSLPPFDSAPPPAPSAAQMVAGRDVFVQNCLVCHAPPGQPDQPGAGPLPDYPKLAGDTLILGRDPTTVMRIILGGAQSALTPNESVTYSMPAFAALSDQQIADVATYIRNDWGNRASPVTARAVASLRPRIIAP